MGSYGIYYLPEVRTVLDQLVENLSKNPPSQQFALQICSILHPKQLAKTLSSIGQVCGISATTAIEVFEEILYAERKVLKIGHDLPLRRYWANEKSWSSNIRDWLMKKGPRKREKMRS